MSIAVFFRMSERGRAASFRKLRHKTLKKRQHIAPDIRIRPLIDRQATGRMGTEQQHGAVTALMFLRPA